MPARVYAGKGPVVEEWADGRFFRPAGWRIATTLAPTRISPDAVTLASLVLGVIAGHLFWYANPWINAAGVVLFIWSDVLDSADGQLARLRGTSTRMGRILDGLADSARFLSLYAHLGARTDSENARCRPGRPGSGPCAWTSPAGARAVRRRCPARPTR